MAGNKRAKPSFTGNAADNRTGLQKTAEAENVAARLPAMELEARNLASLILGLRNKSKPGPGLDFHKYRDFRQGDNPHKIDWKASARRVDAEGKDRLLIRDREMQVTQQIYIWADASPSMNYRAPEGLFDKRPAHDKRTAAEILALAAGYIALKSSETFTLLGSDMRLAGNKEGIERMRAALGQRGAPITGDSDADIPKLPIHRGRPLGSNSHVFVFSDFLCPLADIGKMINSFHHAGVKGHLVQILDPADIEFRHRGHVRLRDMEGKGAMTVRKGEAAKDEIERRVQDHIRSIEDLVKKIPGWKFSIYVTDQPLHEALLPLYGIKPDRPASRHAAPAADPLEPPGGITGPRLR